jgi:hypothetical protein
MRNTVTTFLPYLLASLVACDETPQYVDAEQRIADRLVAALAAACPLGDGGDATDRRRCAEALADADALRGIMGRDVLWGGHAPANHPGYEPALHHLTRFDARVYRMMYLSTFMFSGDFAIEREGALTIVRAAATFRRDLDIGEYPYPFWHTAKKWTDYLDATELLFVLRDGKLVAVYRTGSDATKPRVEHTWDGQWTWGDDAAMEPRVALYSYILSPTNPHLEQLNDAYRALEERFRDETCSDCHAPDNSEEMSPLVLLTYPNQALGERHRLLAVLDANAMPPDEGVAPSHREGLRALAFEFARLGDEALRFEGEPLD